MVRRMIKHLTGRGKKWRWRRRKESEWKTGTTIPKLIAMSETSSSSNTLTSQEDQNSLVSVKRNRPGTKLEDINNWEHQEINEFDSSFEAQQYLQQLIKEDNSDVKKTCYLAKGPRHCRLAVRTP
eukprot:TRINITY_DN175_c0_g2_i3.p1 TRINITY_DN175_c0_g2~~TRINITY_DN175_c0_g2_i3.p1  ORF type:complete len:125 (-),score=30.66 TRINITY_DN175_c0_g2_i3:129-503(-)